MGWLFKTGSTRRQLIAERTRTGLGKEPNRVTVTTTCLAHCYRGNVYSGVLWAVWERRSPRTGRRHSPQERWITCDLLRYRKD